MSDMELSDQSLEILKERYLRDDTPEQRFQTVARVIAEAERVYAEEWGVEDAEVEDRIDELTRNFYEMMANLDFLPNSPTIMNANRELGQLQACFVVPVDDCMEGIFQALKDMALIQKSGGGVGFSFSRLRPQGAPVDTTKGVASGPVSFMRIFDKAAGEIKQGGARRCACIGVLRVDHPDIHKFITCKTEEGEITNFNISVAITDEFMKAVENGDAFDLRWKGKVWDTVDARGLWKLITKHAWLNGEPGVIFIDTMNDQNPTPHIGDFESTNPCGEVPLLPYEACNLGSINLSNFVKNGKIDWARLERTTHLATKFLDNVITANTYPLPEVEEAVKRTRKIGLGVMGFADMLIEMGIPYASKRGLEVAEQVMVFIQNNAYDKSKMIAERYSPYDARRKQDPYRRNASCITIAPTGSISLIADTSSGIEPIFAIAHNRQAFDNLELAYTHPKFQEVLEEEVDKYYDTEREKREGYKNALEHVVRTGSCQDLECVSQEVKELFKTAPEISPERHVRMQAAFQKHTDNSISKTINCPNEASVSDVANAIEMAYHLGCKGLTVYRVGSRENEVLTVGDDAQESQKPSDKSPIRIEDGYVKPLDRPKQLPGVTRQEKTGCGSIYVTINSTQFGPHECFTTTGGSGGCTAFAEGIARVIALALRCRVDPQEVVKQLTKVTCDNFMRAASSKELVGKSCPDTIGRVLRDVLEEGCNGCDNSDDCDDRDDIALYHEERREAQPGAENACPDCSAELIMQEGCRTCIECGWTFCG